MEALYHQTNGLLSQTQGYYVRLEQVDGYITIFVSQNWLNWSSQGSPGDDLERLEVEVEYLNLIITAICIQCSATYFMLPHTMGDLTQQLVDLPPISTGEGKAGYFVGKQ